MHYIYSIINKMFSNTPFPHFMNAQNHEKFKFEYKITLMYLVFRVLWILFSDKVLEWFISDHHLRSHYQTYKGTDRGYGHLAVCGSVPYRTATKVKAGAQPPKCNTPANAHRSVLPAGVYFSLSLSISFSICSTTSLFAISPSRL